MALLAACFGCVKNVKAKYTVFVPNSAKNVAIAAHHYLSLGPLATHAVTVHHGTPFDTLVAYAEDTPEMDSHLKQLGVFVGEVANAQTVTVAKEGKNVATWEMGNPFYQPQPQVALQPALSDGVPPVQPQAPASPLG